MVGALLGLLKRCVIRNRATRPAGHDPTIDKHCRRVWRREYNHARARLPSHCRRKRLIDAFLSSQQRLDSQAGQRPFLPDLLGWLGAVVSIATLMFAWRVLAAWNEQRRQIGVLKL